MKYFERFPNHVQGYPKIGFLPRQQHCLPIRTDTAALGFLWKLKRAFAAKWRHEGRGLEWIGRKTKFWGTPCHRPCICLSFGSKGINPCVAAASIDWEKIKGFLLSALFAQIIKIILFYCRELSNVTIGKGKLSCICVFFLMQALLLVILVAVKVPWGTV